MASRITITSPFFTACPGFAFTPKILPGIGALTFTAPCAPAGAAAFGAALGAAAFGAAALAAPAVLPVPSSTVTSYTFPLTVIV